MAKILDFKQWNERRFWKWAREWLIIPENEPIGIDFAIAFLVANKVFTIEEIRAALRDKNIVIHERIFESAIMINEKADLERSKK